MVIALNPRENEQSIIITGVFSLLNNVHAVVFLCLVLSVDVKMERVKNVRCFCIRRSD